MKVDIGIIGVGYWGKKILQEYSDLANTNEEVEVRSICDLNEENLRYSRQRFGVTHVCHDYRELLNTPEIDAVNICTPNETHYKICRDALNAKKHVLLEKPMTLKASEARELIRSARKNGLVLSVGHIFRFDNALRKVRDLVRNEFFGDLYYLDLQWTTLLNLPDRDIIDDLAPHPFDIINFLTDMWPTKVTCRAKGYRNGGREEVAFITCEIDGQALGHMHLSWLMPGKTRKVRIAGSQKAVEVDCVSQRVNVSDGVKEHSIEIERNNTIRSELIHFIDCVTSSDSNHNYTNHTDGNVGARVVELLEAARKSLKAGKTVLVDRPEA